MSASSVAGPSTGKAPAVSKQTTPPQDDEMLDNDSGSESEGDPSNAAAVEELRRQTRAQARQIQSMMDLINQMTTQMAAQANAQMTAQASMQTTTPAVASVMAPKMAPPEKYEGGRMELPAFLTNMDLYCYKHNVPNDQDKILTANLHMKGKAANWMQPYVEDYLKNVNNITLMRTDTKNLFTSWSNFVEEMKRIFGEVDAENQAEKAITRLKQTKSVSHYTAEFKQLQSRISWNDAALQTAFENGLKDAIKDSMVHHEKPGDLHALIELATRIDNRLWERNQQKNRATAPTANARKPRQPQFRREKDGDVIMADKVQNRKDKKSRDRNDGLSKEERQRRYDNKACLRCGEEGHFRKDCPKKEESKKQGTVKIGMIRASTPYPEIRKHDAKEGGSRQLEAPYPKKFYWDTMQYEAPRNVQPEEVQSSPEPTGLGANSGVASQHRISQCTQKHLGTWYECIDDECRGHAEIKHQTG